MEILWTHIDPDKNPLKWTEPKHTTYIYYSRDKNWFGFQGHEVIAGPDHGPFGPW